MKNQFVVSSGLLLAVLNLLAGCGPSDTPPAAIHGPGLVAADRPDTPGNGLQFNFEPGEVVESAPSAAGKFLVHFTRNGVNAVPAKDDDGSGTPDFVEEVAKVYDEVLVHYEALGFRAPKTDEGLPDNGGDGRFDVYLVDFAGVGDGVFQLDACDVANPAQCTGYMVQENDYKGYGYPTTLVANRILGSHEFFHAVQAAYDRDQGSVFAEGTAVWATETFDSTLNDFEYFIDGYLNNTSRSLDVPLPGPVDPFSYGSAIFFQFLEEKYGAGTVRTLVERTEDGAFGEPDPKWLAATGPMLEAQTTFPEAFIEFATWNLFVGANADPTRSYANGAKYPPVKMEPVTAPYSDLLRLFYASSQYYRALPDGRGKMTAALASAESAPGETADVALLLVAERNGQYEPVVRVSDVRAGSEEIDTMGADAFITVVVNTTISGNSRRPVLCIGTAEEVAACKVAVEMSGAGAGGGGGMGGAGGAGAGGEPPPPPPEDLGSCGCSVLPKEGGAEFGAMGIALAFVYRRARRRAKRIAGKTA